MRHLWPILCFALALPAIVAASDTPEPLPAYPPAAGGIVSTQPWGVLWHCGGAQKVAPDTPTPSGKKPTVGLSAARNEYEPFQLVFRPSKPLANVNVTAHSLIGPKGAKLPAWNVTVRNVEYVSVTEPTGPDCRAGLHPDPLPPFQAFDAPANTNTSVWVTVYIPDKTPAGDYSGSVSITADGQPKVSVPVKLRVWDFTLPTVSRLRTAYGRSFHHITAFHGAATTEQKRKLLDIYNLEFWKHRIAPYTPYDSYDIKIDFDGESMKLDFSEFDVAVQKYLSMFNSFMLPRFGMGDKLGLELGDDYERIKIEYMRAVAEHLADKGQISKAYNYIMDEPTPEQYDSVVAAADLRRKADQRIKVLLTEQIEPKLVGSVDIWTPLISNYNGERAKERQSKGEEVWWYVCCVPKHPYPNNFIDYPAIDQRILPWITWSHSLNGILYWDTAYWLQNPWEQTMSVAPDQSMKWGNGDGRLLYPPVKAPSTEFVAKGPVPSIRWEMIREGIEDYDYFRILQDRADKARKANPSNPALAKADEALKLVKNSAKSRTDFTRDPEKLLTVRAKVAEAIMGLK